MTGSNSDDSQETAGAMRRRKEDFLAIMSHEILTQVSELLAKGILLLDSLLNPVRHRLSRPLSAACRSRSSCSKLGMSA